MGARLVENLKKVQYENGLFKDSGLAGKIPQFTIEMETGTGKTFVYLETILRLWQDYGNQFKKFIIVVPSNAILMGVKKSIEMLSDYFKPKFQNIDISEHFFVYDKNCHINTVISKFIESTELSIMLITCHSFNKDSNRLRTATENGIVVWDDIKDVSPIVIIDEPQKMDGTAKKKSASLIAVEELEPLMILRYSATHKNLYNQIYKLDSYDAYQNHLVKNIKVTTLHSLTSKAFPYVRYVGFNNNTLRANIEIFCNTQNGSTRFAKFEVDNNASLEELSNGLPQYKNWYIAEQPNKLKPLAVSRADGTMLYLNKGTSNDEVAPEAALELQMEIAIRAHLDKQIAILNSDKRIKALTLFFVDSVAKVRGDTEDGRGEYLVMFDALFDKIRNEPIYQNAYKRFPKELAILDPNFPVSNIREGYFAKDKNKKDVDIEKWDSSVNDEEISFNAKTQEDIDRGIDLILNKKDELISFDEKLTFIFSHSALREGWDNPNVFTLVTLKQGGSEIAKKQEIGRGLRLPVDADGCRCKDNNINELTVIANDYYDQFAAALQEDYNQSMGFDKNEVSVDIISQTIMNAGVPEGKREAAFDAFRREITALNIVKVDKKDGKLILTDKADKIDNAQFSDAVLIEHSEKIIDEFKRLMVNKGSKKISITNGDETPIENGLQKYVTEEDFYKMYRTMLKILQKRSIYRYKLDKDAFIEDTANELNKLLNRKSDKILFEITNAKVDFDKSKSMQLSDTRSVIEENKNFEVVYPKRSIFDITNYIMYHTMLPRLAIFKIIDKLNDASRNKINNQDYLEEAVNLIKDKLVEYKSKDFLTASIIDGTGAKDTDIFEMDKIFNDAKPKLIFTPNPAKRKALNRQYKFESNGERDFADGLEDNDDVLMYTKLKKGGFVIETPVGGYSPDWAIVYQNSDESFRMYFIAETKWKKSYGGLTDTEKIKIHCAEKHFEAVNNEFPESIKYAWVNAYKDASMDHSFPQVFFD